MHSFHLLLDWLKLSHVLGSPCFYNGYLGFTWYLSRKEESCSTLASVVGLFFFKIF